MIAPSYELFTAEDKANEAATLGSMMVEPRIISQILAILDKQSFYLSENQAIFGAIEWLYSNNKPVDGLSVRNTLRESGRLDEIGLDYLKSVIESTPHGVNGWYYAQKVSERHRYRQLVQSVCDMQQVLSEHFTIDEQTEKIQQIAFDIKQKPQANSFQLTNYVVEVAESVKDENIDVIPTGFCNIDNKINGLSPGDLAVIGGRPSMGKTALGINITNNMIKRGLSVVYFTLEQNYKLMIQRILSSTAEVNLSAIKSKNPPQDMLDKFYNAAVSFQIKNYDLTFHEAGFTPEKIVSFIDYRNKIKKVDCAFVDHVQLLQVSGKSKRRYEDITEISRKLKLAAMRLQIPIVALSQLNRAPEAREHHKPRISDLRESGSLEQDADVVMLLHREDYYRKYDHPDSDNIKLDGIAELIISKNKNGPVGTAKLMFMEEFMQFSDLTDAEEP